MQLNVIGDFSEDAAATSTSELWPYCKHTYIFLFNKLLQCSPESQKVHPVLLYLGDPENPVMQNKQKRRESERESDHELKLRLWLEGCNQGTLLEVCDFFFFNYLIIHYYTWTECFWYFSCVEVTFEPLGPVTPGTPVIPYTNESYCKCETYKIALYFNLVCAKLLKSI